MSDPTLRFSSRVADYIKYRPGYPPALLALLVSECGLNASAVVADIGSGTGILSELLLQTGAKVFGVEPNREMREAGELLLQGYPHFHSVAAGAEQTRLPAASVDLITAAQAFHWFDPVRTRAEFARILRPGGWVVLVWNARRLDSTPFLADYEHLLLTHGTDYREVNHRGVGEEVLERFFAPLGWRQQSFENIQPCDFDGVKGRLLSSSYVPAAGSPGYAPMLAELAAIFAAHARAGQVAFEYDTDVYYGQLSANAIQPV